jgi:hypothetical protein
MTLRPQPSEGCASASFATSAHLKHSNYTGAIPAVQRESNTVVFSRNPIAERFRLCAFEPYPPR